MRTLVLVLVLGKKFGGKCPGGYRPTTRLWLNGTSTFLDSDGGGGANYSGGNEQDQKKRMIWHTAAFVGFIVLMRISKNVISNLAAGAGRGGCGCR